MKSFPNLEFMWFYQCHFQFKMWSTADDSIICRFTSDAKDKPIGKWKQDKKQKKGISICISKSKVSGVK